MDVGEQFICAFCFRIADDSQRHLGIRAKMLLQVDMSLKKYLNELRASVQETSYGCRIAKGVDFLKPVHILAFDGIQQSNVLCGVGSDGFLCGLNVHGVLHG